MTPQFPSGAARLRTVLRNAGTLTGGRLMLAVLRFGATLLLVQRAGLERFGEFALVLAIVMVAEWLSDFGLGDVAVRQMLAQPARRSRVLGAFALAKLVQGLLAAAAMVLVMGLAGYDNRVLQAGAIASLAVVLYGGVQVYRVEFRARQQMGRDVGAELLSAVVFLVSIWLVTSDMREGAPLVLLAGCYVLARLVNLMAAAVLAESRPVMQLGPQGREELRVLARASVPLGLTGLMVATYDAMEQVALSHGSTPTEVGIYSFAMRIVMLAMVAQQALATAVYPVLAEQWVHDRAAFKRTLQAALDWGLLLAGALFCALHTGAPGLIGLVKADAAPIAHVLQLLSWALMARAAVSLVGPMLVISGQLARAVWIPLVVLLVKAAGLSVLVERGASGAAMAYLIAEVGVGLLVNLLFCQYAAGLWLRWSVVLRLAAAAVAVVLATQWLGIAGTLLEAVLATLAYLALAALLGAVKLDEMRQLISIALGRRRGHG